MYISASNVVNLSLLSKYLTSVIELIFTNRVLLPLFEWESPESLTDTDFKGTLPCFMMRRILVLKYNSFELFYFEVNYRPNHFLWLTRPFYIANFRLYPTNSELLRHNMASFFVVSRV